MTTTLLTLARQPRSWAAALLAALATSAAVAAPVYHVIDLGSLRNTSPSDALGINAQGDVIGWASPLKYPDDYPRPVRFVDSGPVDLITETGVDAGRGTARAINSEGHIVGDLVINGVWTPFVYRQGTMEVVEKPQYYVYHGVQGTGLSDLGHLMVDGFVTTPDWHCSCTSVRQPDGTWVMLQRWKNGATATGNAISRDGTVVVGFARAKRDDHFQAMVWRNNKPKQVPGTEGRSSNAKAINDRGDIAGNSFQPGFGHRAYVVRDGQFSLLTSDMALETVALGMDNLGRVVGHLDNNPYGVPDRGILAQDGQVFILDDLVEPDQQGKWRITTAVAINDAGEIAAYGVSTTKYWKEHALKLVPVTPR